MLPYSRLWACGAALLLLAGLHTGVAVADSTPSGATYIPESTSVAVLPVINMSKEKDKEARAEQADRGTAELKKVFADRGFRVIDDALVQKGISDGKIDLTDEEFQKRSTIYQVGQTVNADLAAFAVIEDVEQHTERNLFSTRLVGTARVKVWLLDVKRQASIVNGEVKKAKAAGGAFSMEGGSRFIISAVAGGIRDNLKDFLKPYPLAKDKPKT